MTRKYGLKETHPWIPAYRDSLRPWCQDGLQLDTCASTGGIFAFTLRKEFSHWSDRTGSLRGTLLLSEDPSRVPWVPHPLGREQTTALHAGVTWPSCCLVSRALLNAQAAGVTEGSSPSKLTAGETTFTESPRRLHIPRTCVLFAITHSFKDWAGFNRSCGLPYTTQPQLKSAPAFLLPSCSKKMGHSYSLRNPWAPREMEKEVGLLGTWKLSCGHQAGGALSPPFQQDLQLVGERPQQVTHRDRGGDQTQTDQLRQAIRSDTAAY